MARSQVKLDSAGIAEVLKSAETRRAVNALAEQIADNLRAQGHRVEGEPGDIELPVKVYEATTDRARASVQIAHPSGKAVQAKHGAITRAAAEAGLEVRGD